MAWWLRRKDGRHSALTLLAVGVISTTAAYFAGSFFAGSVLSLISLASTVGSVAAALAGLSTS